MITTFSLQPVSGGVQGARFSEDGALAFKLTSSKARLHWGDQDDNQPLDKRIYLPGGYIAVRVTAQQSLQATSTWTLAFWTDGKRQPPQPSAAGIKLCGSNPQLLVFKRDAKPSEVSPDGMEFVTESEKGNEIRVTGLEILTPRHKGCFRQEFVVPAGAIWLRPCRKLVFDGKTDQNDRRMTASWFWKILMNEVFSTRIVNRSG